MLRLFVEFLSSHPVLEDVYVILLPFFTVGMPLLVIYRWVRPLPKKDGGLAILFLPLGVWLSAMQNWLPPLFEPIGPHTDAAKLIVLLSEFALSAYGGWRYVKIAGTNLEIGGAPPAVG